METQAPTLLSLTRAERRKIRWFFAGLLVAVGLLDVFQAMFAQHPVRDTALEGIVPTGVSLGGRTAAVVAGLALLLLARGILRGKRVAWQLTLLVLAGSVAVHLVKNLDFEEGLIAFWVLLGLWWMRGHFEASSEPAAVRRGLVAIAAATGLGALYALAGDWLLVHNLGGQPGAPLDERARWFVQSMPAVAGALLLVGLVQVLRPVVAGAASGTHQDVERCRAVAERWGHNFTSWLSLVGTTDHFWAGPQAYVAYRVHRRVAIALGDPVAAPGRIRDTAQAFHEFCDRRGWASAVYGLERPEVYRRLGYTLVPIGSEAIVRVADFKLQGRDRAGLRTAVRRCERDGISFSFLGGDQAWELESDQLRTVSAAWLRTGKGPEMRFSMGTLQALQHPEVTVGLAHDRQGKLLAFVSWLPVPARHAWTLDLMRRRPEATPGVMEALIVKSFEQAGRLGVAEAALGLAPLSLDGPATSRRMGALRLLYRRLDRVRGSRSLRRFKAKFGPRWEPRYLAVPDAAMLPEVLAALIGVHLPWPLRLPASLWPLRRGPAWGQPRLVA
jgi:phosphatidylglycerol lysyltransferase